MSWIEWLFAALFRRRREPQWKQDEHGIWRIAHEGAEVVYDSDGWRFRYSNEYGHLV